MLGRSNSAEATRGDESHVEWQATQCRHPPPFVPTPRLLAEAFRAQDANVNSLDQDATAA
jgi:hypothetical protein